MGLGTEQAYEKEIQEESNEEKGKDTPEVPDERKESDMS